MRKILSYCAVSAILMSTACGNQNKEEKTATEEVEVSTPATDETTASVTGFKSIEKLAQSVVTSLKAKDYASYYSHVMTEEIELKQAELIQDSVIRKEFLHEYGFSLHEEEEYFNDLINYFDSKNIDLNNAKLDEIDYTEYKGGEYHPLELYEVFIPIQMDYEMLIDFTIIKVGDEYYLTSELGF